MANSYLVGITLKASDQASAVIAAVRAPLAGLQVGLKGAADSARTFDERWGAVAQTGTRVGMVLAGMGAAVVGALGMAAKSAMAYGRQLYEASQRTNLSVESLTALRFAAEQSGMAGETLEIIFSRQARSAAAAAAGTGAAADAYKKIGVSVTDANGNLRDNHELMLDTAEGLKNTTNATERMALAIALFGRGAKQMLPLLMEGRAGIERLEQKAKDLGLTLSTETAKSMDDLSDSIEASTASMAMSWLRVGGTILPVLATIAEAGASAFKWLTTSPVGWVLGAVGTAAVIAAGGVGVLLMAGIKLSQAYFAAQAAMLAFGETAVGIRVATVLCTIATGGWSAALGILAGAASTAWKAITGSIGWILLAIGAVAAGISWLVGRHNAAKDAADEQAKALKKVGTEGVAGEDEAADATDKAAEAVQNAKDATVALADAQKESARAAEDQPRAVRDAAIEVRNAQEAQQKAWEGIGEQAQDSAEKVADAEKKVGDALKDQAKVAQDSARAVGDAERNKADAVEAYTRAVEEAGAREKAALEKVADARKSADEAMLSGKERAAERVKNALAKQKELEEKEWLKTATPEQKEALQAQKDKEERDKAKAELAEARKQQAGFEKYPIKPRVPELEADKLKREGDKSIQEAQDALDKTRIDNQRSIAAALRAVAIAERALADARVTAADAESKAAERVNEAEKALGKAREEQDKGREEALKRYRDAQEAFQKAVESSGRKIEDAADRMVKAAAALEKAAAAQKTTSAKVAPAQAAAAAASPERQADKAASMEAMRQRNRNIQPFNIGAHRRAQQEWEAAGGDAAWNALSPEARAAAAKQVRAARAAEGPRQRNPLGYSPPGMAGGGAVAAGRLYTVNETGIEYFRPSVAGTIIPLGAPPDMGGNGGGCSKVIIQNFAFNGPMYGAEGIREVAKDEIGKAGRAMAYAGA